MDRKLKGLAIANLHQRFLQASSVIVTRNRGLTAAEMAALRQRIRASGGRLQVAKNRLALIAVKGTRFESMAPLLRGPSALAYCSDPIETAKAVVVYGKENQNLEIVGASIGGKTLEADHVVALTHLPPLEVLRWQLIGLLCSPGQSLARVLARPSCDMLALVQEPGSRIARLLAVHGGQ